MAYAPMTAGWRRHLEIERAIRRRGGGRPPRRVDWLRVTLVALVATLFTWLLTQHVDDAVAATVQAGWVGR